MRVELAYIVWGVRRGWGVGGDGWVVGWGWGDGGQFVCLTPPRPHVPPILALEHRVLKPNCPIQEKVRQNIGEAIHNLRAGNLYSDTSASAHVNTSTQE